MISQEIQHWSFTDGEKVILRNLPKEYKWIARDIYGGVYAFHTEKPIKKQSGLVCMVGFATRIDTFNDSFQIIQWSDEEPCEFRKYI